ncbi:hypothetical protein D8B26_003804 [Coccidioides posadasii str. Silveira]|uniref:Cystathionine gamma-synthase n=1 Tax=Coccidioides posadasii (strain RMSCC 757 / Silveira) TaxID=443226 RepID=E9D8Y9_COCPS|nr:cystathionine gamma-synthase [Coccidioides posadasii str. Silveira]QVM09138.1 hypothetical protein D8B26_003804 [Coccidioides posadasii str. Silveira]
MAESLRSKMEDLNLNGCSNATVAIHADDPINVVTDVAPPLHVSTTFRYSDNPDELVPLAEESEIPSPTSHVYSRYTAPNYTRFETIVSALLGGHSVTYASGLAALNAALIFFNPKRISVGNGYHGSHGVISIISRLTGLKKIDLDCPAEQLEKGDLILLETPVNPHGTSFNIQKYAEKAHSRGAYLLVDSTFGPPGLQDPFLWGADMVMHSGTKYLGGHSDMLCGVLATKNDEWRHKLFMDRQYLGNIMGNMESWLGVRSLRTLEVRVQRQSENATSLVAFLDQALKVPNPAANDPARVVQAAVKEIFHSSLQENDMAWLSKQMPGGFGPVFSMTMKEERHARAIPSKLKFFHHATSLGGVESLIEWRAMSDDTVDRKLLRLSVGLESWTDLRDDLLAGFQACLNL